MKYLKLGEKASIFFDATTRLLIRGKEVVAVRTLQRSKKLSLAMAQGHVCLASEAEYEAFKIGESASPVTQEMGKDELYSLSDEAFKQHVRDSGFTTADQKKILKSEDRVKTYREVEQTYE